MGRPKIYTTPAALAEAKRRWRAKRAAKVAADPVLRARKREAERLRYTPEQARAKRLKYPPSEKSKERKRAWTRAYYHTAARKAYLASPAGRAMRLRAERKYRESVHGRGVLARRRDSLLEKWRAYKKGAAKRGIEFMLTLAEFSGFWQAPCTYCTDDIKTIGLDRMSSRFGYTAANVAPCCTTCNYMKRRLSQDEFIERCAKIARHSGMI